MKTRSTPWTTVLLLCGKCSRKLEGGFGEDGDDTLRSVLKAGLKAGGYGRGVRVLETRCMGLCPKKAVAALNASRPDRLVTIPKRADVAEVIAELVTPAM